MSPDRVSMTRAEAIRRRREEEQKRREELVKKTIATPKPAPAKPKVNQTPRKPVPVKAPPPADAGRHSRRYDIAMSAPYGRAGVGAQTPKATSLIRRVKPVETRRVELVETMPKVTFGARWISFLLIALCGTALYFITSDNYFVVSGSSVVGNNRVSAEEISSVLGVMGKPAYLLSPAQIEYNVLATFPDIDGIQVSVNLPAEVVVTVSERQPVAAWQQDGQTIWVDAQGYAFPPRGLVEGLVTVSSAGAPPTPSPLIPPIFGVQNGGTQGGPTQTVGARPFLSAEMTTALMTLSPHVPQGAALIYDPRYGLGWTDPRGWQTYFGHSGGDFSVKLQVYQSMLDYLSRRGISPKLISVEYPDAPFYRTEKQ